MIRLNPIASNMTVLTKDGNEILFSYQTPVAVYDSKQGKYLRTQTKYSRTTSKHINKWMGYGGTEVPQTTIEDYVR